MNAVLDIGKIESILDEDQLNLFNTWVLTLPIGNLRRDVAYRFKFTIVPTSVGEEINVIDLMTGEELDLSMAENW